MRSAMASSATGCRRVDRLARCSRSRTTSDLEILRPRDSASMSATSGSGKRTVSVFMKSLYYMSVRDARHRLSEGNASLATPLLSFRLNDDNNFVVPAKMPDAEHVDRLRLAPECYGAERFHLDIPAQSSACHPVDQYRVLGHLGERFEPGSQVYGVADAGVGCALVGSGVSGHHLAGGDAYAN